MKIAIASINDDINSEISPQAGRAPYYLIFENGELIESWKNVFRMGGGGVGPAIAKVMKDKGVDKIISANFGDKIIDAFDILGIAYEEREGIVKDNL